MFKTIIRYAFIVSLCLGNNSFCKNINPSQLLKQVINDTEKGPLSREKEEHYAQQLRYLMVQSSQKDSDIDQSLLDKIQAALLGNIRRQFPSISDKEYKIYRCIGEAFLFQKYPADLTVKILIRESKLLFLIAESLLAMVYEMDSDKEINLDNPLQHDSRILAFFKKTALEGHSRSQYYYGRFLLYGIGTQQNISEGLRYLNVVAQKGFSMASLDLASYYKNENDLGNYEKYLQLGAGQNSVEALSKLTVFELKRANYKKALRYCTYALELEPEDPSAKMLLGVMYLQGLHLFKEEIKGFTLIKEAAEKMDLYCALEMKRIAYFNLRFCYENGIGTEKSPYKAQECSNKLDEL